MVEDRDDLLRHYRQMREELLAVIEGLSDEALSEPSLDGWSVKDHMLHLALWDEIRASEVRRIAAGYETAWRTHGELDESINQIVHEVRQTLSVEQAKWELASSREALLQAIAFAGERGLDGARYGEAGLRSTHEAEHAGWIKRWRGEKGL